MVGDAASPSFSAGEHVVASLVSPLKPPEAFKTVVEQAVTPLAPPEAFKTVVSPTAPETTAPFFGTPPTVATPPAGEQVETTDDSSGNRFVYAMLALAVLGFLAGLAMFLAVYVFGEKPNLHSPSSDATSPAPQTVRTETEILDASIKSIELCGFQTLPSELNPFDSQTIAKAFPAGVRLIAVRIRGKLQKAGDGQTSDYQVIWRRAESPAPLMAQAIQSASENQPIIRLLYWQDGKPLPAGVYVVEVRDGDRLLARDYFTIGVTTSQK